jgi:thioredoxin reductase (NADPH)
MNYNTIIIGSGVAGMTAAIYLKRANVNVCIIEKEMPGGQITRTSTIENYPGFTSIEGSSLATNMYNQVTNLDVPFYFDEVISIEIDNNIKKVITKNNIFECSNIIITTGRSPKRLNIESEEKFINKGISFCGICDGPLYKNKDIAVIGGGNSAFEEAFFLASICKSVTIIHRNNKFKASTDIIEKVKNTPNITILTDTIIKDFIGTEKLEGILLVDKKIEEKEIKVNACFEYIGEEPNTSFLKNLNILDKNGYIKINKNYETNIKGIYAGGDCIKKDFYQIITACSDAVNIANIIIRR